MDNSTQEMLAMYTQVKARQEDQAERKRKQLKQRKDSVCKR